MFGKKVWGKALVCILTIMLVLGSMMLVSASELPLLESDRVVAEGSTESEQSESEESTLIRDIETILESDRVVTEGSMESEQSESEETVIESEDIPLGAPAEGEESESEETTLFRDIETILELH